MLKDQPNAMYQVKIGEGEVATFVVGGVVKEDGRDKKVKRLLSEHLTLTVHEPLTKVYESLAYFCGLIAYLA